MPPITIPKNQLRQHFRGTHIFNAQQNGLQSVAVVFGTPSFRFHILVVGFFVNWFSIIGETFAAAVPRAANAESQGFEAGQKEN